VSQDRFGMKNLLLCLSSSCVLFFSTINASEIQGNVSNQSEKLENAVVYIKKIEGKTFLPPKDTVVLNQTGLRFIPHVLPVIVGTTVKFPNEDVVLHNVFSPGYITKFNLGTYPQGSSKIRKFNKPGVVLLLCNIHHEMSAFIVVVETSFFAVTGPDGNYKINNVPPGKYKLAFWHEGIKPQVKEIEVPDQGIITVNFPIKK
jgi:plastocyanin